MAKNKGKQFEAKLKEDFLKSFPLGTIDRLYDSMTGYRTVSNISDFIAYNYPHIFYLEAKTHNGNTFPLVNLTQYEKLVSKVGIKGVRAGVVIWFVDHDRVVYIPISTITKMKKDGHKSVNITKLKDQNYRYFEIPSIKKRVFMDSDYSILKDTAEGD